MNPLFEIPIGEHRTLQGYDDPEYEYHYEVLFDYLHSHYGREWKNYGLLSEVTDKAADVLGFSNPKSNEPSSQHLKNEVSTRVDAEKEILLIVIYK